MYITSSSNRPVQQNDAVCLSKKAIVIGYVAGVTIIALGIILAAVYWPRGSLQVLMTHEGQAVIGLVLGGIFLSSIFGALLLYAHHKKTLTGNVPITPKINRMAKPTIIDFENAEVVNTTLIKKVKPIKQTLINTKYLIAVTEQKGNETAIIVFDREENRERKTITGNIICDPQFLSDHELIVITKENNKSSVTIHNLQNERKDGFYNLIEITNSNEITSICVGKDVETATDKRVAPQVLFVGYKDGHVDVIEVATRTKLREEGFQSSDSLKISSLVFGKNVTVVNKNQISSLLIGGTEKKINFWNLSTPEGRDPTEKCPPLDINGSQLALRDGKLLTTINERTKTITVWNLENLTPVVTRAFSNVVNLTCFNCDRQYAVTGTEEGNIVLWAIESKTGLKTFSNCIKPKAIQYIKLSDMTIFSQNSDGELIQTDFHFQPEETYP